MRLRTTIKNPPKIITRHTHLKTFYLEPFLFQDDNLKRKLNSESIPKQVKVSQIIKEQRGGVKAFKSQGKSDSSLFNMLCVFFFNHMTNFRGMQILENSGAKIPRPKAQAPNDTAFAGRNVNEYNLPVGQFGNK